MATHNPPLNVFNHLYNRQNMRSLKWAWLCLFIDFVIWMARPAESSKAGRGLNMILYSRAVEKPAFKYSPL